LGAGRAIIEPALAGFNLISRRLESTVSIAGG
jgi:hypothetical protein